MAANGDIRTPNGQFATGHAGGPGRPAGTPNHTSYVRDQLGAAVEAAGGQVWINRLVRDHLLDALKLLARPQPVRKSDG